jgi:DNA-binding transcriptional MerR regulator
MSQATFGIGDLAREFGVTPRTIRFYEDEGMLAPRREGQRRIFTGRDRTRLKLILRGRRLGFPLAEIRKIINLYDEPAGEAAQLELLLNKIKARQTELEAKQRDLKASLQDLDAVAKNCQNRLKELKNGHGV